MQKIMSVLIGVYKFGQEFFIIGIFWKILYKYMKTIPAKDKAGVVICLQQRNARIIQNYVGHSTLDKKGTHNIVLNVAWKAGSLSKVFDFSGNFLTEPK